LTSTPSKSTFGLHHKISRRRTLKRGAYYRSPRDEDLGFVYAAYKQGAFHDMAEDLDFDAFSAEFISIASNGEFYIGIAPNRTSKERTEIPVGLITVTRWHSTLGEPHIFWFPWATKRNKVEVCLKFITEMRHDMTLAIFTKEEFAPFFDRMKAYGVIKHNCKVFKFWPDGSNGRFYQSIE
jgi:hypothetical protein